MNWYKKNIYSKKNIWEMPSTSKDYAELSLDDLYRDAFGFTEQDIKTIMPHDLNIKYQEDMQNPIFLQEQSGLSKEEWARTINLSDPIQLSYEGGKFYIEDGHHRYYAALILNKPLFVDSIDFKDKPHRAIIEKSLLEGKTIPHSVLMEYPDLAFSHSPKLSALYDQAKKAIQEGKTLKEFLLSQKKSRQEKRQSIREWKHQTQYEPINSDFYRGKGIHSPACPESGSPLYDLTENETYPEDVYSYEGIKYYGTGDDKMDHKAYNIISKTEGFPNKAIRVYRAVEKDGPKEIQPGDWVTIVREYAKEHGEANIKGGYKILSKPVFAQDLYTEGDSWLEYGYHPQNIRIPSYVYLLDRPNLIRAYDKAETDLSSSSGEQ